MTYRVTGSKDPFDVAPIPMRILLTGQTGDTGSVISARYREEGRGVIPYAPDLDVAVDRIVHAAARHPVDRPEQIYESNLAFTKHLIDYGLAHGATEFVFLSSVSIYGDVDDENIVETRPACCEDMYSLSKLFMEKYLGTTRLKVLSVRLPGVLEVKKSYSFMSRLYDRLARSEEVVLANPHRKFNAYICPESIYSFIAGFSFQQRYDVVNMAMEKELTVIETVELMKKILRSSSAVRIEADQRPFRGYSIEKAKQRYGYMPPPVEQSLRAWCERRQSCMVGTHRGGALA